MMIQRIPAFLAVLCLTGCNLYTELDRPSDAPVDAETNANNVMVDAGDTDNGDLDMETFTDAEFMGDERWRAIDVEIGDGPSSPIAWRIPIPDGIASSGFGPGGAWLRVYDEEGNPVARQIESWTTGAHIFWVNVDPGPGAARRFWIQYGIEPDSTPPNPTEVWTAGSYLTVWGFASEPGANLSAWIGNAFAEPVEGNGTFAIGGGRVALCVEGSDGWTVPASRDFGIARGSQGKTFELIYRADPGGSTGRLLSTEALCNGVGISIADSLLFGRVHAGLNCDSGFPEGQAVANRSPADTTEFTHATLTVQPVQQGYDLSVFINGSAAARDRVITNQNDVEGNRLAIANFEGEAVSACIDQVHVIDGVRTEAEVEAAFRGSFGESVSIGGERPSADFATP